MANFELQIWQLGFEQENPAEVLRKKETNIKYCNGIYQVIQAVNIHSIPQLKVRIARFIVND